jgi:murein DD-endopeptidase MepM/ murein hydrolase activator NlpD
MPRLIGSDVARQYRSQAQDEINRSSQALAEMNQHFSETSSQITQTRIQENSKIAQSAGQIAQANAQTAQYGAQKFGQFAQTVQAGLQQQQQFNVRNQESLARQQEAYMQAEQEKEKKLLERNQAIAHTRTSQQIARLKAQSRQLLGSASEEEVNGYLSRVDATIFGSDSAKYLTPEAQRQLYESAVAEVQGHNELIESRRHSWAITEEGRGYSLSEEERKRGIQAEEEAQRAHIEELYAFGYENAVKDPTLNNLLTRGQELARENSPQFVIDKYYEWLQKWKPVLSLEDERKFTDQVMGQLREFGNFSFEQQTSRLREVRDSQLAMSQADMNLKLSGTIAAIRQGDDIESHLNRGLLLLGEGMTNPNLDPVQSVQLYAKSLEDLAAANIQGVGNNLEIKAALQNLQDLQSDPLFIRTVQQWTNGEMTAQDYSVVLSHLSRKYEISREEIGEFSDPNAGLNRLSTDIEAQRRYMENRGYERGVAYSREDFDQQRMANWAMQMVENPAYIEGLLAADPEIVKHPSWQAAEATSEAIKDFREISLDISAQEAKLTGQLAQFNSTTLSRIRKRSDLNNFVITRQQMMSDIFDQEELQRLQQSNPQLGQPPRPSPGISDEQYQGMVVAWASLWRDTLSEQIKINRARNNQNAQIIRNASPLLFEAVVQNNPDLVYNDYQNTMNEIERINREMGYGASPGGVQGNFNQGAGGGIASPIEFKKMNTPSGQMLTPFAHDVQGYLQIGDSLGAGRGHAGLDIAAPMGTPMYFYTHGTVLSHHINNPNPTGYGNYVDIQTASGQIHRFAHLQSPTPLKPGQKVTPGMLLGNVGSTGRSTGPHLHWEIRRAGQFWGMGGAMDVSVISRELARTVRGRQARGDNAGAYANGRSPYKRGGRTGVSGDAMLHSAENMLFKGDWSDPWGSGGSSSMPANQVYNTSQPLRQSGAPFSNRNWTPAQNHPENNYGYNMLAQRPTYAKAINDVATRLGVPGVWIADIIAMESSFRTNAQRYHEGRNHTGVIQFSDNFLRSIGTNANAVSRMTFPQQMEIAYKYWTQPQFQGRLKSIDYLLAAVWGGEGLMALLDDDPRRTWDYDEVAGGTGGTNWYDYLRKLGRDAGRRYNVPYLPENRRQSAMPLQTSPVAGCSLCNQMQRAETFVPHVGVA